MQELGELKRIDARQVWKHEALEFTPWLRERIALLGNAIGLDLDLVEAEVAVGPFSADLVAKDVSNDRLVVIENQLEPTDHSHLGQLLTYGAGIGASVFVWVTPEFRDEHRAAIDWLNEHSDDESLFFGVVVELLAVDDSKPAPNFRLVSFPNDVTKGPSSVRSPLSPKGAAYAEFFGALLNMYKERFPGETNVSKASPQSWLSLSFGRAGLSTGWAFTGDKRFRCEFYIDIGDAPENEAFFDELVSRREQIEAQLDHALDWDKLEGRRACRVSSYYHQSPITVMSDEQELKELGEWGTDEMRRLRDVLKPFVHGLNSP